MKPIANFENRVFKNEYKQQTEDFALNKIEVMYIKKALRDRLDVLANSFTELAQYESNHIRELLFKLGD